MSKQIQWTTIKCSSSKICFIRCSCCSRETPKFCNASTDFTYQRPNQPWNLERQLASKQNKSTIRPTDSYRFTASRCSSRPSATSTAIQSYCISFSGSCSPITSSSWASFRPSRNRLSVFAVCSSICCRPKMHSFFFIWEKLTPFRPRSHSNG